MGGGSNPRVQIQEGVETSDLHLDPDKPGVSYSMDGNVPVNHTAQPRTATPRPARRPHFQHTPTGPCILRDQTGNADCFFNEYFDGWMDL